MGGFIASGNKQQKYNIYEIKPAIPLFLWCHFFHNLWPRNFSICQDIPTTHQPPAYVLASDLPLHPRQVTPI